MAETFITQSVLSEYESRSNMRTRINIIKASVIQSLIVWKSYKSAFIFFMFLSILFAMLPIFLGQYIGGSNFAQNFQANGGGDHPIAFILIGTNGWTFILYALWDYGTYLREEQQQGTLESLFLTPANQILIIIGRGLVSGVMATGTFIFGLILGLLILDPTFLFSENIFVFFIAVAILFVSFIPILGVTLALGAVIIRFKEVEHLLNVIQFMIGSLMGVFFPIVLLPIYMQIIGLLFPGTWMLQDIRYIITGSPPVTSLLAVNTLIGIQPIFLDIFILIILTLSWGFAGWFIFSRTLGRMKRNEGIGEF